MVTCPLDHTSRVASERPPHQQRSLLFAMNIIGCVELAKENEMNTKTEGTLAIIAALIVLFSAMWNPLVSTTVSIVVLAMFGIYKFMQKNS